MEDAKLCGAISFLLENASDAELARIYVRLHQIVQKCMENLGICKKAYHRYISKLGDLHKNGSYPYNFEKHNPPSILYTSIALGQLIEFGMSSDIKIKDIVNFLLNAQSGDGWWREDKNLLQVDSLPFYQDPDNVAARIFNTSFTASVLVSYLNAIDSQIIDDHNDGEIININYLKTVSSAVEQAVKAIEKVTSTNGVIAGFPQNTWFTTSALSYVYSKDSPRFLLHWSVLCDMLDRFDDISSVTMIAEGLLEANIHHQDPLLSKCKKIIKKQVISKISPHGRKITGWGEKYPDTATTLRALIILYQDKDR